MAVVPSYIPDPSQTDPQAAARAATLGIGIAPRAVPPVYAPYVTQTPGIIAEYGTVVFLHDDGTQTAADVAALIAPLNTAQAAAVTAATKFANAQAALANAVATLQADATAATGVVVTPANMVAVLQTVVNDLGVLCTHLANLLITLGHT